jgi:hypothetical protein
MKGLGDAAQIGMLLLGDKISLPLAMTAWMLTGW